MAKAAKKEEDGITLEKGTLDSDKPNFLENYVATEHGVSRKEPEEPTKKPSEPEEEVAEEDADLGPQLRNLADKYGIAPKALEKFQSVDEAERALTLMESQLIADGEAAMQQAKLGQEDQTPEKKAEPEKLFELDDFDEDDPVRKNLSKAEKQLLQQNSLIHKMYEHMQNMQYQHHMEQVQAQERQALKVVEDMGLDLSGEEQQELFDQYNVFLAGYQEKGKKPPALESLIERAAEWKFGDKVKGAKKQEKDKVIQKRAKKRLGSPSRPAKQPNSELDQDLEESDFLKDLFYQMQESGG